MVKRTLYFDVIQDTRFSILAEENVSKWTGRILNNLTELPVKCQLDTLREVPFSGDEPCISYRQRFYVRKTGRVSWDRVYKEINKVRPCRFQFLACHRLKD